MSKVASKRLGDLITLKRGYDLPEKVRVAGPYPVISSAGISGYHNAFKVEGPGVVTGRYGTLGEMYYAEGRYWPHNTALYVQDFKGNDPKYIYYLLGCLGRIRTSDKSAVPGVNRNELHEMEIPAISDPSVQVKVRKVLETIDKKVDLNNRINAELESMAKMLYDYWFVQFDFPDANGKPYKTSGGKMVYNATLKREIPAMWGVSNLGEIAELYQPKTISGKDFISNGKYLVYGANGIVGRFDEYNHVESVVTITCRGNTCGNINITRPYSWITGNAMVVRPKCDYLVPYYIYNLLLLSEVDKVITGSAQPQITRANLAPLKVVIPDSNVTQKFSMFADNLFKRHTAILDENETLQKLRDWILPLLMNGQVTVK
ncbi:restriction endonuclease subunit S [Salmonella enterica]|uniref:restriction endonuclease subunit S n=1 Tax=Salmonella enterica TaxID=28901 RepID=UPI000BA16968|nr:restriction endonuclease subunit S [Salmonella enterica]EBF2917497.1 restriction endonuclease subunit S [Salmonella enterica subsp. enterica serovar Agama]ECZ5232264.1 restriction endonuclease subunit S [Salmonella enterica subsp. enterica serovar Enteritidis]EEI9689793.1 restriction endonuclease subunit S [Salmonella enterica subsp. enterica serovar Hillingdon]EIT9256441.1 restriction endonuclease subunit S [Salmonella enterica subsp. enterica serovar Stanleyville]EAZ9264647.1 restriction 